MHPALSVIVFTTATGAGYGLLAWLGVFAAGGMLPTNRWFALITLAIAFALITGGLLTSALHLGRPERAWRAFSQWRSSWLSREGIASLVTYVPAGLFAAGWVLLERYDGAVAIAGLVAAACAIATVGTTGMIYASLKPVAQWHTPYTMPGYVIFALMSGAVLLNALLYLSRDESHAVSWVAFGLIAIAWFWKNLTWHFNGTLVPSTTLNTATGLAGGDVRSIEWPHSEENYLLKEMGYRIARKHAEKLRMFVHVLAFGVPLATTEIAILSDGWVAVTAAVLAVLTMIPGLLVERWLFFAEAKHTVTLYYGRQAA
jgi:sulfite dehydrogenase (quinone) subunit SoeC